MAMNILVGLITLAMVGFAVVWASAPKLRSWMEAPKYRVLDWDGRKKRPFAGSGWHNGRL